jgi:S1/P1 Nuclease
VSTGILRWISTITVVTVGLVPAPVWAWGHEGHVIVAKIAESNLKPATLSAIKDLLGPTTSIADAKIATFADFVRHNQNFPEFSKSAP